jgi:hippurate hydrolase
MPIVNRVADLHNEITQWRRDFHTHPELRFDVHRTAGSVAEKLKSFGCDEVVPAIGRTGVVGVIRGRKAGSKVVGLRADMDALPLEEETGLPYKSTVPGKMHACGHDGHTAMLLGAAKYLAETRNFPGLPIGEFAIRPGPLMAAADHLQIQIDGKGGHAARPHLSIDTILVGAQMINQLQSIVARNVDPLESAVVSVCMFEAGHTDNVIPQHAFLRGTARSFTPQVRELLHKRIGEVVEGTARIYGASAKINYTSGYPVVVNHERQTAFAAEVAGEIVGKDKVDTNVPPVMGAEDFSFMLQERPGAFIFIGNGDSAGLHHPAYDFNDEAIPVGTSYWVRLAESALAG